MIHLSAFINRDEPIPGDRVRFWTNRRIFPDLKNQWIHHYENLFMSVQGNGELERFVHCSPRLVLICHTDLLGSGECNDFYEANRNPAAFLARLYEQRGDSFARDLHGWFGIVLYDHEQRTMKAWTDHFGVRRLVYKDAPEALGIASDLRLLNGLFPRQPEIDSIAVVEYLQHACIPAPRTIYKGAQRLESGHFLTSKPRASTQMYWDMSYPEVHDRGVTEWAKETYKAIESAVALAVKRSDESSRLGCFLSGGTDSSSVSGLVGNLTGQPTSTLSIGFEDPRYNEIEYARIAARHFRTDHHEYFVKPEDVLDLIQRAYTVYDEPFGNSSIVPAYHCARLGAENGVSHMLGGDGGDELFGGNQRYADDRVFQRYLLIPQSVRSHFLEPLVTSLGTISHTRYVDLARRYIRRANIPPPDRYASYDFLSTVDWAELFSPHFHASLNGMDPLAASRRHFRSAKATCNLNRWLYLELKVTITDNDLRKVTSMTELAGVVPRYPFLDPVLAEFSGVIPAHLKVRGTRLRYLFKRSMSGFLPPEILTKKKHGFGLPFSIWLGEHKVLREFVFDILGSDCARQRGYTRPDLIEWLWERYNSQSRTYYGDIIWIFLMLELWHLGMRNLGFPSKNSAEWSNDGRQFKPNSSFTIS
jgi:asparagine synthase (glutamine-hydrolysing)